MKRNRSSYNILPPCPESFLESARSFGYGLETAIADLVDNCITAKATEIFISYGIDQYSSHVRIVDNGVGMSEERLLTAMKMGSANPSEIRDANDLGRFGLGLKTASFSQCRRLTVSTKDDSAIISTKCWDLDLVAIEEDWILLNSCFDEKSKEHLGDFNSTSNGTIVLWEKLDRLIEANELTLDKEHFYRKFDNVKKHLGLIFHRFIEDNEIIINVLGDIVKPINPFHVSTNFPSTELQEEQLSIKNQRVIIQPFILPHESKISKTEKEKFQMMRGWTEHQGIYLYRNKRLISDGTWLDLNFRIKESQRLCRIAIDIPNTLDKEWQIDVKKASAKIPDVLRKRIKEICFIALEKAVKVYTHRGAYLKRKGERTDLVYIWKPKQKNGKKYYEINTNHPIYRHIINLMDDRNSNLLKDFLKLIAESVPISMIVNDFSDPKVIMKDFFEDSESDLKLIFQNTLNALINSGMPKEEAIEKISLIECFQKITPQPNEKTL